MKTLKSSSILGVQQRLSHHPFFLKKRKKQEKILSYRLQFVWVAFFALILKTVSMLVIETILIYLSLFQFVCLAETLSVHGLCF